MKLGAKQSIQESFRVLLRQKPLDKITVRDIVEDCGLTRNTFYYHYTDIYDLFDDYLDSQMQQIIAQGQEAHSWEESLGRLLVRIFDSPRTGRHIFYSKRHDTLRLYLNKLLAAVVERYIEETGQGLQVSVEDRRLICDACSFALYGLLEQWVTGPEAARLEANLHRVAECFDLAVHNALNYCAKHPRKERSNERPS